MRLDDVDELGLPLEQRVEVGVGRRHLLVDLLVLGEHRAGFGDSLLDVSPHVLVLVERRLLQQDPDRVTRG